MKKRILSLLLALVMITTLLPLGLYDTAWAAEVSETAEAAEVSETAEAAEVSETAEATEIASGSCGAGGVEDSSVRWVLTSDGTLTISGTGAMCDKETPWWEFRSQINRVVIESGVTTVGTAAFSGCKNLTEAVLPDTLTAINSYAFEWDSLVQITIPDGVTTIGDDAFRWNRLVDVVIPDSVTTIGKEAFMHCEEMQTLHLGSGLTSIGANAFKRVRARVTISADNRSFSLQNNILFSADKAKLIQCFDNELTHYDIPIGVQEIGVSAFDRCSALQNVTIPDTVQLIGSRAFEGCRGLERLDIPASVTYIAPEAFFQVTCPITVAEGNTSYLNENGVIYSTGKKLLLYAGAVEGAFQIPDGVEEIGAAAFSGAKLSDVTIPGSVTDIGYAAFLDCQQLQSVTLPGSVQSMGNQLFAYCNNLVEATIGDGISVIPTMIFDNCTALTSVSIPRTVTLIKNRAFIGCDALETVHYAGSAEEWEAVTIEYNNEALNNANFYFNGETGGLLPGKVTLTGAVVGENGITVSWRRAANAARYNVYRKAAGEADWTIIATVEDTSYTDVAVEMGMLYTYTVRGIASDGETLSPSTTDVTVLMTDRPSGGCGVNGSDDYSVRWVLTDDGTMTISGTGAMCDEEMPWRDFSSQINRVVIESGVTTVGSDAFNNCRSLTAVELPGTLTAIGDYAFAWSGIAEITIPDGVVTIGAGAFQETKLVDVVIPDSVTTIGESAFRYCEEMKTLYLGSGLTTVEGYAFDRCEAAVTLSVDNRAFVLEDNALLNAEKTRLIQYFKGPADTDRAETYTIPTGVEEICSGAFGSCGDLKTIVIPNTVQRIGREAFDECRGLERLDIPASVTYITPNAFFHVICPITVAEGNTSYFDENGVIYSTGKKLLLYAGAVEGAFQIPDGVEEIGAAAFSGAKLSDVTIPGSVTDIGYAAFFDCWQLQSVTLPGSVQSMGNQLFGYCNNLVEATIGDGISVIPAMMFDNCTALTSVSIPKTVTLIESSAFTVCDALEAVYYAGSAEEWEAVTIEDNNEALHNATLYPNFSGDTTSLPPGKVTLTGAKVGENGISVSWRKAVNAAQYNVYRKAAGEADWTIIATVAGTSYADTNVKIGELYTYTVRGVNANGILSTDFDADGITVLMTDGPSGGCGVNGSDDYSVRWVLGEDGTMTISGTGAMCDEETPWWEFRSQINRVVIESGVTTVGSNTFNNCDNLTAVELPDTLTAIGDYAFAWSNVAEITIPDGVVTIGAGAFWETKIVDVVIPDSVTTIGESAFRYCWEMKTLHLGSGLTTVEGYAFDRCEAAVTLSADNRALVLEDNALLNAEKTRLIQYFEGPKDTDRAEAYTIPTGVEEICDGAFDCCDDLKTIVIPDTVQRIGQEAFGQCSSLEGLTIPASVTKIESSAFLYNKYPVHVAAANTAYCSEDGVVYSKNKDTLCYAGAATGAYSIPNGVAFIGDTAASGAAITSLTLPASVEKIGDEAFQDCEQLQTLTFLGSIKEIGRSTFSGCHSLNRVTIPEGLKKISASAFSSCTGLRSVTIPKSVTTIEWGAFEACDALLDVYYAGSKADWERINIDEYNAPLTDAAIHYDGSTEILVPDVVTLGEAEANADGVVVTWEKATNAVWYKVYRKDAVNTEWTEIAMVRNTSYTDRDVEEGATYTYTVRGVASDGKTLSPDYDTTGVSVKVDAEPENLGRGNCGAGGVNDSSVRWILTSDGTMTISGTGAMAMWEAEEHPWLELRDQIRSVVIQTGVTTVGSYAFSDCNNLETVEFPNTLTTIGEGAFMNSNLRDVVIPDSVRTIESNAFAGCGLMYKLSLGSGLTTIGDFAFEWCSPSVRISEDNRAFVMEDGALFNAGKTKLIRFFSDWVTSYTIPTGVKEIGAGAFEGGWNLKTITIPDGVQSIRTRAFAQLWKLERLTIPASVTEIAVDAFSFTVCPITVAADNTAYCSQDDALYSKDKDALLYAAGATGAFIIPNTVVTIEESAFSNSTISSVTIPNSVKTIGNWAFSGCVNLQTVTLPASVTEIGEGVFGGCTNLTSVRIPASVKTIQKWTFEECEALTDVYYDGSEADWKKIVIYEDGNEPLLKAKLHTSEVVAPANVKLVSAKVADGGIQVTWQAADGAVRYRVYRKDAVNTKWEALTSSATGTSYVDDTAKAGVKYSYTVRGIAADGKTLSHGFNKTGVSATIPVPANVKLVSAKAVSDGIQVTWKEAAGAAEYRVYRKGPNDKRWVGLNNVAATSYVDDTAKAGVKYSYTVRGIAFDGKTLSPGFNETGVSAVMAPANVKLGTAVAGKNGITVKWQAADGAKTYKVYRKDTTNTKWTVLTSSAAGTSYVDKTAAAGVKYSYTVRGIASDGKTLSLGYDETGVSAVAAPANVKLVSAKAVSGGIKVTWKEAAGAAEYRVYRKGPNDKRWVDLTDVTGKNWTDTDVTNGVKYSYTVRGIAFDGKTLSPSYDKTGVSAVAAPANVELVGAAVVSGGIQVKWQAADGAVRYRVYRKDAVNTKWTTLTTSATGTSWTDKTAKTGVTYSYTVRGIAADGKTLSPGFNKTGVSATIPVPANVKLVGATAVSGGIQVTWQAADGAAEYRVYRKDAVNTKWKALTSSATGTSYVDDTAKAGVKYSYTVRGIAADGKTLSHGFNKTGVSATIPVPANVKLVGATAVSGGIQVTWQAADGAAEYRVYRKDAVNTKWKALTSSATGTSYVDDTAKAGVKYSYTVRGIAFDGKTLSPSYDKTGVSAVAK